MPPEKRAKMDAQNAALVAMLKDVPPLPFTRGPVTVRAPAGNGHIYLLQRGDKADPIVVVDESGKVLRS